MANIVLNINVITKAFLHCLIPFLAPYGKAQYVHGGRNGMRQHDEIMVPQFSPVVGFDEGWNMSLVQERVHLSGHVAVEVRVPPVELAALSIKSFSCHYLEPAAYSFENRVRVMWPSGATMVTTDLAIPYTQFAGFTGEASSSVDPDSGLSVRCLSATSTFCHDMQLFRFEMLFGFLGAVAYQPSKIELEMLALLAEARAQLVARLATLRMAA